ncbi:DUF6517 family protein [Salarchaeum sp. JOR-1]|uniref:DUF6517 family protein n=1 Tax=Salarchaeum sp. JOR-1 TaxID=2599399 RepID=UPI0011983F43|nr:DUF6517 family protein [Salarchaeum sp. JOR-1]QDX41278.1 hypothetical protein FQU85_10355 [Salarchaeum sp. JOR-1]
MSRRTAVAVALAALVLASGCLGFLSGPVTFNANKVTVEDSTLQSSGYEEVSVEKMQINRTFEAAGQSKTVEITNWVAQYEKRVSILGVERRAAVFGTFSSPEVSVLGQSFNPLDTYNDREIAQLIQQQYGTISDLNAVSNTTMTVLGHSTTVTKFSGTANFDGQSIDVFVHVTKVNDGGDIVAAVGVYPQQLDGEEEHVHTLLRNLRHAS